VLTNAEVNFLAGCEPYGDEVLRAGFGVLGNECVAQGEVRGQLALPGLGAEYA
jgi:hypothetical protein